MISLQTVIAALKLNEPPGKEGKPAKVISDSLKEFCIAFILKQYQEVIAQVFFFFLLLLFLFQSSPPNQQIAHNRKPLHLWILLCW